MLFVLMIIENMTLYMDHKRVLEALLQIKPRHLKSLSSLTTTASDYTRLITMQTLSNAVDLPSGWTS